MAPIRELPDGYQEIRRTIFSEGKLILWLNVASLIPIAVALILMALWWIVAAAINPTSADSSGEIPWLVGLLLAIVVVLPLHELIHGVVIRLVGHRARRASSAARGGRGSSRSA